MKIAFNRNSLFLLLILIGIAFLHKPVIQLAKLSLTNNLYSYFLGIPVVSLYFFVTKRKSIFKDPNYSIQIGAVLLAVGSLVYIFGISKVVELNQNDHLCLMITAALLWLYGAFIACYGSGAFRRAIFPLLFFIFMIPIPTFILDPLIQVLVIGSAHATHLIFFILDVPFIRDGFVFELPGVAIEIAEQCSGIRSTLGLFIASVVAGYLFLPVGWKRIVLVVAVFPITMVKNAIRISVISLLAVHVDMSFLTDSFLHKSGGFIFYILALGLMLPVLLLLRRTRRINDQSPLLEEK
jgi:exosortase